MHSGLENADRYFMIFDDICREKFVCFYTVNRNKKHSRSYTVAMKRVSSEASIYCSFHTCRLIFLCLKQVMLAAFVVGIILLLLSLLSSQIGQTAVQAINLSTLDKLMTLKEVLLQDFMDLLLICLEIMSSRVVELNVR